MPRSIAAPFPVRAALPGLLAALLLSVSAAAAPAAPATAGKPAQSAPPSQPSGPRAPAPHIPPGLAEKAPLDPALVARADSLRRAIERRTYSDADKKAIRSCDREKADFLKQARAAEPEWAKVDQAILQAKINGADPNDPAVTALLERKFAFEKAFDDRYLATPKGRKCADGAARRLKAVNTALEKDKPYQDLLKRIAASGGDHL